MSLQNLFKEIESFEFGARVGVASGFRTFGSIVCNQNEVKQLRDCIEDGSAYRKLWERAVEICNRPIDQNYENPWDISIAVYLTIIQDYNPDEGQILAEIIVEGTPNLFWARKVALAVLSPETQKQSDIEQIKQLLQSTGSIIEKHEKIARLKGENFNVFRLLGVEDNEVKLHSRFIFELLNPKGSHDQGTVFLKMFLEKVVDTLPSENFPGGRKIRPDESKARVKREHYIREVNIAGDESTGGRIDIFITDGTRHISIENKIGEGEGEYQVTRYCNYKRDSNLVLYLTPCGTEPSTVKAYPISYRKHILRWLESCHKHCTDLPSLGGTIKQYIDTVKKLTGGLTMQKMNENLEKLMSKKIEAAHAIYSNYESLLEKTVEKFVQEVKEEIEQGTISPNNWKINSNDGNGLRIRNTQWVEEDLRKPQNKDHHIEIEWEWTKKNAKSEPFYSIVAHKEHFDRDKIKEKLDGIEKLLEPHLKNELWPFWTSTEEADFQDPNQLKTLWNKKERIQLAQDIARKLIELMDFCDDKLLPSGDSNS